MVVGVHPADQGTITLMSDAVFRNLVTCAVARVLKTAYYYSSSSDEIHWLLVTVSDVRLSRGC